MNDGARSFGSEIEGLRQRLADQLDLSLPRSDRYPAQLHEAMRYACQGGKRMRALLVYATGATLGASPLRCDPAAVAVELIHAYSLVHDDLPAMDDDLMRRGQPTCHAKYGEAVGILVGDGLQALAFQVLAQHPADLGLTAAQRLNCVSLLAEAAGSRGMVGGQAVDIASEGQHLNLAELEALHVHKTGALIRACVSMACACADRITDAQREALDHYAKCLGLAYQIQDDLLDIDASSETLGKTAGKDAAQLKSTYPQVMGLPAARERARDLFASAEQALTPLGPAAEPLLWLSGHMRARAS